MGNKNDKTEKSGKSETKGSGDKAAAAAAKAAEPAKVSEPVKAAGKREDGGKDDKGDKAEKHDKAETKASDDEHDGPSSKAVEKHEDVSSKGKSNSDDDKKDGRGHGDGDHNDDGHADNGQGPKHGDDHGDGKHGHHHHHGEGKGHHHDHDGDDDGADPLPPVDPIDPDPVVDDPIDPPPPPVDVPVVTLNLATADVLDTETGAFIIGTKITDVIVGGAGNDRIIGKSGDDVIHGDGLAMVTVPLSIKAEYSGIDGAEALSFVVDGVPEGAKLSAGKDNGDGTWTVSGVEVEGLTMTVPDTATDVTLKVTATTTDGSNLSATESIHVTLTANNADEIQGGQGNDELFGGLGDDVIYGGSKPTGEVKPHVATAADNDVLHAGDGRDTVYGNAGDDKLFGDAGDDWLSGGKGNDVLDGGAGDDVLKGNSGDDVIVASLGNDVVSGGAGFDTLDFSSFDRGVHVDLRAKTADGDGFSYQLQGIEAVVGTAFDDSFVASMHEGSFTGGGGHDTFAWTKKDVVSYGKQLSVDHVTDFEKDDVLDLRGALAGQKGTAEELLRLTETDQGTTISARIGGHYFDVVALDNVHGLTVNDMLAHGLILA
jgi:Ca2+-binding RTX toxin-like protein